MPGGGVYYKGRFHLLYVNIDYIEMLRQIKGGNEPDPVEGAIVCDQSGCDGIMVHLHRGKHSLHIHDILAIKERIRGQMNIAMTLSDAMAGIANQVKPKKVIIVPEKSGKMHLERGLDVRKNMPRIIDAVQLLHDQNTPVALCIEPDMKAIGLAKECGADCMAMHVGAYRDAASKAEIDKETERIYSAANYAVKVGLKVSAGYGLDYKNIGPLLKARALEEVIIGHSIISRSIFVGLAKAVEEMLNILE